MAEHFPQLATHFPGNPETRLSRSGSDALSAFEREFVHAIRCRQLFPVFQPIVDSHHRLQGMEILSRWRARGYGPATRLHFCRKYVLNTPGRC